jgi:hypothetical protein
VWLAGTPAVPVNGDWTYAYLAPANCLMARRIVNPTGVQRAPDPAPIRFRTSTDPTTGVPIIFTNQAAVGTVTPELEYTVRVACAATMGDALFRSALAWRLAAAFAPALSRDKTKVEGCLQMYKLALVEAEVPAANESQADPPDLDADWIRARSGAPWDWTNSR